MKTWRIPVSWMMSGVLEIDAKTLKEACDMAYEPEIGLPEDGNISKNRSRLMILILSM